MAGFSPRSVRIIGGAPPQGSPAVVYHYDYLGGAAWHYNDDDGLIDSDDKTWSDYRGYGRVAVTIGDTGEQGIYDRLTRPPRFAGCRLEPNE